MKRRDLVRAGVAAAGVAAAGCSDGDGLGGLGGSEYPSYDHPAYGEWPPAEPVSEDFVLFTHYSLTIEDSDAAGTPTPGQSTATPDDEREDEAALFALPAFGILVTALAFAFGMWNYPWSGDLAGDDEPDGMNTESLTLTDGAFVFHGEYDAEAFADQYADGFDEREKGEFVVFEGQSGGETEGLAYAVSEDAVVAASSDGEGDPAEILDDALSNRIDEAGRVVDDGDGEWLYEATGPADAATGFWRTEGFDAEDLKFGEGSEEVEEDAEEIEDSPVFDNVDSFIGMMALPESEGGVGGDEVALRFAALYPEGEVPSEDELREGLVGADADADLDITTTDDRAHVAAEVSEDELDAMGEDE